MQDISIRITQRLEFGDRATERSIDLNLTAPSTSEVATPPNVKFQPYRQESAPAGPRFTKIAADGSRLPAGSDRTDHVAVIDNTTGLMWSVESMGDPADEDDGITQEHCLERCKQLRLLGFADWHLPSRSELAGLVDDTRHEPAIDVDAFPRVKSRWHWTSTPAAWSSASAWFVYFNGGLVNLNLRSLVGFALACRRAGQ